MSGAQPNLRGKDFNYYQKLEVSNSNFPTESDLFITFQTQGVMFYLEETIGVVELSFNGNTLHLELNAEEATKRLYI